MPLYDRLAGRNDAGVPVFEKISIHTFQALMAEVARGRLTGAQAVSALSSTGSTLTGPEQTEANTLLGTITSLGTATAKLARAKEIDDVLLLAEAGATGYAPSQVKTRLGV